MRVRGSVRPKVVSVEPYPVTTGKSEVRLRENIKEVVETDSITKEQRTEFEYDEYVFIVDTTENLEKNIVNNLDDWIKTGRTIEVNERASSVQDIIDMLNGMGELTTKVTSASEDITNLQVAIADVYEQILKGGK